MSEDVPIITFKKYKDQNVSKVVGRARLLPENCIVSVLTNIPTKQCTLIEDCRFLDETSEESEIREDMKKGEDEDSLFA